MHEPYCNRRYPGVADKSVPIAQRGEGRAARPNERIFGGEVKINSDGEQEIGGAGSDANAIATDTDQVD